MLNSPKPIQFGIKLAIHPNNNSNNNNNKPIPKTALLAVKNSLIWYHIKEKVQKIQHEKNFKMSKMAKVSKLAKNDQNYPKCQK